MNNEVETTITLITNPDGFYYVAKYIEDKYNANLIYETNIRYNDRMISERERLRQKHIDDKDTSKSTFYRVVIKNTLPNTPIPFTEIEKYIIPEKTITNECNGGESSLNGIVKTHTIDKQFQKKSLLDDSFDLIPYTLEISNTTDETNVTLIGCTWKSSMEEDITEQAFNMTVLSNINDTDGSFVPVFGQHRCCLYNIQNTGIRLSVGKAFEFGGVQEGRRPMNEYYYVEFEKEYNNNNNADDDDDDNDNKNNKMSLRDIKKFVREALTVLPHDVLFKIIIGANDVCVGQENRIAELLDDYTRTFTYDFECFRRRIKMSRNNKKASIFSSSSSYDIVMNNVYLAPKWDGVRGIGVWEKNTIIIRTIRGLREFVLPSYCLQRLIVQVEMFINDNNDITQDRFIITEIFGTSLCTRKQTYGYFYKSIAKKYQFSRDQCNMSDTLAFLHPQCSLELMVLFHEKNPQYFTYYRKCDKIINLVNWFYMKKKVPRILPKSVIPSSQFPLHILPTDGVLAIVLYDDGKHSLYTKLKNRHTIELAYDITKKTLHTYEQDVDVLRADINISGLEDTDKLLWYKTGIDSHIIVIEFELIATNNIIINHDDDDEESASNIEGQEYQQQQQQQRHYTHQERLYCLLRQVQLKFVKIRYDKFIADSNKKIMAILQNYFIIENK